MSLIFLGRCTGMGMDLTTTGMEVRLRDPEEDPLPPAPLLVVATSDGALRLFSFSHASRPTQGTVRQPLPLQAVQPVLASEDIASEEVAQVRALLHCPCNGFCTALTGWSPVHTHGLRTRTSGTAIAKRQSCVVSCACRRTEESLQ